LGDLKKVIKKFVYWFLGGFMPFKIGFFVVGGYFFSVFFFVSFDGCVTYAMLSYFAFGVFHLCTSFLWYGGGFVDVVI
jgi:hypothetical protein